MPEFERDFVLRHIRRLADLVARIVARAHAEDAYAAGLEALRAAMETGPGKEFEMLQRLEPASAALLVQEPEVLSTLARIATQEGDLRERGGDRATAQGLRLRALALYAECAERFPAEAVACRSAARALSAATDLSPLAEKYRRWLA
jgi:hypothetical protein